MKPIYSAFVAAGLLVLLAGCCCADRHRCSGSDCPQAPDGACAGQAPCSDGQCAGQPCAPACHGGCAGGQGPGVLSGEAGPPTGAISYPYYTTRGPRDYFDRDPSSIGP